MARITGSLFLLSGKMGNNVFRVRNSKQYVASYPKKMKIPDDEGSIKRRNLFAYTVKLVAAVCKINNLVSIWRKYHKKEKDIKSSIYKATYFVNCIEMIPQITPHKDFTFNLTETDISTENFEVTFNIPPLQGIEIFYEPLLLGCMMLYYTDPEYNGKNKFHFLPLTSNYASTVFDQDITLQFNLTPLQLTEFNSYPLRKIYFALLTIGRKSEVVKCSSTIEIINVV